MLYRKFIVRKFERALLYKDGDFHAFLAPGTYRYLTLNTSYDIEIYDITKPEFNHRLADFLMDSEAAQVRNVFDVIETGVDEVALVYINDQVNAVLGPAERKIYFKGFVNLRVERYDLTDGLALEKRIARQLVSAANGAVKAVARNAVVGRIVPEGHVGLLYVDGEIAASLGTGLHAYFNVDRTDRLDGHACQNA